MQQYMSVLKRSKLFEGLNEREILLALNCLNGQIKEYKKGENIFIEGEKASFIGILLFGEVLAQKVGYDGSINMVSKLYSGEIVAASACYCSQKNLPFDIVSACESKLLCIDSNRFLITCSNACSFHTRLIQNMLKIISDKNMMLASKIDILTKRTIKDKIMSFLYAHSKKAQNKKFTISLSRRQMAEYLSINRSALSRELCNLRDKGILDFNQNSFTLNT